MTEFRVLVVDDEVADDTARELRDSFEDDPAITLEVDTESDFNAAERRLIGDDYDVVVLDVKRQRRTGEPPEVEDPRRGTKALDTVRRSKFVPVVLYTALDGEVQHLAAPPFVQVIAKDEIAKLPGAVRTALQSGVQTVVRGLKEHVDRVIREFLWDQVTANPSDYNLGAPATAKLLAERVGVSLEEEALPELVARLSAEAFSVVGGEEVVGDKSSAVDEVGAAATRYLYPPVGPLRPGAVLRDTEAAVARPGEHQARVADGCERADSCWWTVLTPACDFAQGKVDLVLLARAFPLEEFDLYQDLRSASSDKAKSRAQNRLRDSLTGSNARYEFLPAFRDLPNLVIDFQHVETTSLEILDNVSRVADLTSPFTESLLSRHAHYRGRIGTPDTPKELIALIVDRAQSGL